MHTIFGLRKRSADDLKSWSSLILTLPLLIGILAIAPELPRRDAAASRQQTAEGRIIEYTPQDHNRCRYNFTAHGIQFQGADSAPTSPVHVGETVTVFFDSANPATNELEDFSEKNRRDRGMLHILIVGLCLIPTIILILRLTDHPRKKLSPGP